MSLIQKCPVLDIYRATASSVAYSKTYGQHIFLFCNFGNNY